MLPIVDRSLQKAVPALQIAGYEDDRGVVCETHASITQGLENNKIPIVPDAHEALSHDRVDVVIDATGVPEAGAELGMATLDAGKHLVMMNVEADVTIGPMMQDIAARKGLVYHRRCRRRAQFGDGNVRLGDGAGISDSCGGKG